MILVSQELKTSSFWVTLKDELEPSCMVQQRSPRGRASGKLKLPSNTHNDEHRLSLLAFYCGHLKTSIYGMRQFCEPRVWKPSTGPASAFPQLQG